MSSFNCEKCGAAIIDIEKIGYVTGCEHYPTTLQQKNARLREELRRNKSAIDYENLYKTLKAELPTLASENTQLKQQLELAEKAFNNINEQLHHFDMETPMKPMAEYVNNYANTMTRYSKRIKTIISKALSQMQKVGE